MIGLNCLLDTSLPGRLVCLHMVVGESIEPGNPQWIHLPFKRAIQERIQRWQYCPQR